MKKKVLSALLAVALFVGLAVPAFAAFPSSSEAGDEENITALAFAKTSYSVEEDGDGVNLADELIAYVSDSKIAQDPTLEWGISENLALSVSDEGVVTAFDSKGSATVTVKAANGKTASVKVTATKAKEVKDATGWKFAEGRNVLLSEVTEVKDSEDKVTTEAQKPGEQSIKVIPTPSGTQFTDAQIKAIGDELKKLFVQSDGTVATATADKDIVTFDGTYSVNDDHSVSFTAKVTKDLKTSKDAKIEFGVKLPKGNGGTGTYAVSNRSTKVAVVAAKKATKIMKTGSVRIEVGQTADLSKFVAYGPSSANFGKEIKNTDISIDPINDNATTADYAVLSSDADSTKILGVAVGQCKAVINFEDTKTEIVVNVVKRGTIAENAPKLSLTTATLEVGGTQYVTVANVPENAEVKWTVDNDNATIVAATNAAKIFAKKVGTAKVTCTVDGTEVGTIEVTVKAASAETTKPGATQNPQTGDSIFAGLF